jgi:hypothetical protein
MRADARELNPSKILRTVPPNQSFFFFEDIGKYTGRLARNLDEFFEIINQIDVKSVTFHFRRGDFDKWIREGLNDAKLARSLKRIRKSASGEELRNKISRAVRRRLNELNEMLLLLETPPTLTG